MSGTSLNGILIVDKPKTWTSHDVCNFIRKRFRVKKVGHAGILDPAATGVLVVLLGTYTRLTQKFSNEEKEYVGTLELGIKTDSHDSMGAVLASGNWREVNEDMIRKAFEKFRGEIEQLPPMTSALRYKGVRLYKLARKGQEVLDRPSKKITVYKLEFTKVALPYVDFSCIVSKGAYVRTLVNDMGEYLGCYAYLKELKRVRSGDFSINNSLNIETLKAIKSEAEIGNILKKPVLTLNS